MTVHRTVFLGVSRLQAIRCRPNEQVQAPCNFLTAVPSNEQPAVGAPDTVPVSGAALTGKFEIRSRFRTFVVIYTIDMREVLIANIVNFGAAVSPEWNGIRHTHVGDYNTVLECLTAHKCGR